MLQPNFLKPSIKTIIPKWWVVGLSLFGMALFSIVFTSWIQSVYLGNYLSIGNPIDLRASLIDNYIFNWVFTFWAFVIAMPFVFTIWQYLTRPDINRKKRRNLQRIHWQMYSAIMPGASFILRLLTILFFLISTFYLNHFVNCIEIIVVITALCAFVSLLQNFLWLRLYYKCGYIMVKLLLLFAVGATLIAAIPIIDVDAIDTSLDKTYPLRNINIKIPVVEGELNPVYRKAFSETVYIGKHNQTAEWQYLTSLDKVHESIDELLYNLGQQRATLDDAWQQRLFLTSLVVDEDYPISLFSEIMIKLNVWHFYKINYVARNKNYPNLKMSDNGIRVNLPVLCQDKILEIMKTRSGPPLPPGPDCNTPDLDNIVTITQKGLLLNDTYYEKADFRKELETLVKSDTNAFKIELAEDISYGDFIKNYAFIRSIYDNLRNDLAMESHQKLFEDLYREEQKEIRKQIPMNHWVDW